MYTPVKPQFFYIKVGCKGVQITRTCFPDDFPLQMDIRYQGLSSSGLNIRVELVGIMAAAVSRIIVNRTLLIRSITMRTSLKQLFSYYFAHCR